MEIKGKIRGYRPQTNFCEVTIDEKGNITIDVSNLIMDGKATPACEIDFGKTSMPIRDITDMIESAREEVDDRLFGGTETLGKLQFSKSEWAKQIRHVKQLFSTYQERLQRKKLKSGDDSHVNNVEVLDAIATLINTFVEYVTDKEVRASEREFLMGNLTPSGLISTHIQDRVRIYYAKQIQKEKELEIAYEEEQKRVKNLGNITNDWE